MPPLLSTLHATLPPFRVGLLVPVARRDSSSRLALSLVHSNFPLRFNSVLASSCLLSPPASCLLPPASCLHYSFSFIFFFFIFGLAVTNSLFSILILSTLFSSLYSLSLSSPSPSPSPSFLVAMASDPRLAQMVGVCSSSSYSSSFHILFQFTPTPPFFQQEKLGSIVGMSTGFPADFPAPIRRRLNALKNLLVPISWPLSRSISRSN